MLYNSGETTFQLAYFAIAVIPILFVLWCHGKYGFLAWVFLANFCVIRVVSAAVLKKEVDDGTSIQAGSILSQVALSPLFFTMFGILHEASISVRQKKPFLFGWTMQIITHLLVVSSVGLAVAGALKYTSKNATSSQMSKGIQLVRASTIILLFAWCILAILIWFSIQARTNLRNERLLTYGLLVAMPILFVRVLYSILAAFINSSSWNFLTGGTLAEKIVLQVATEAALVLVLGTIGILTKRIPIERTEKKNLNQQIEMYSGVPGGTLEERQQRVL